MAEVPGYGYMPNEYKFSVILNIWGHKGQATEIIQRIFLRNLDMVVNVIKLQFYRYVGITHVRKIIQTYPSIACFRMQKEKYEMCAFMYVCVCRHTHVFVYCGRENSSNHLPRTVASPIQMVCKFAQCFKMLEIDCYK